MGSGQRSPRVLSGHAGAPHLSPCTVGSGASDDGWALRGVGRGGVGGQGERGTERDGGRRCARHSYSLPRAPAPTVPLSAQLNTTLVRGPGTKERKGRRAAHTQGGKKPPSGHSRNPRQNQSSLPPCPSQLATKINATVAAKDSPSQWPIVSKFESALASKEAAATLMASYAVGNRTLAVDPKNKTTVDGFMEYTHGRLQFEAQLKQGERWK